MFREAADETNERREKETVKTMSGREAYPVSLLNAECGFSCFSFFLSFLFKRHANFVLSTPSSPSV